MSASSPTHYARAEAERWARRLDAARSLHLRRIHVHVALAAPNDDPLTIASAFDDVERRLALRRERDELDRKCTALDVIEIMIDEGAPRRAMRVLANEVIGLRIVRSA